jgi:hypothetical protein
MAHEFHLNGIKMDNLRRLAKRLPETQSEFINKKHEATSQHGQLGLISLLWKIFMARMAAYL